MPKRARPSSLLIAIVVLALCLSACGAVTTAEPPAAAPTAAAVEATAPPTEPAAQPTATVAEPAAPAATSVPKSEYPPLRVTYNFTVKNADPISSGSTFVRFGIAELLMRVGEDMTVQPWLLKSLEQIDDLHWRLTLKPGITFQNGNPLNAEALAATMRHQLEKSSMAPTDLPGATVEVTGDYELILTTTKPAPTMAYILAYPIDFPVYDMAAVEAVGDDYTKLIGAGVWTGPYQLTVLDDQHLEAERYDGYWQGVPPLPGVTVTWVADAQARIMAVQSGEADIAVEAPSEAKLLFEGRDDAYFVTSDHPSKGVHVYLNLQKPPFDDANVRRAFGFGIDYDTIANDVLNGMYEPAVGLYPRGLPFTLSNERYDPAAAAQLLDEAGWVMGDDGIRYKDGQPLHVIVCTYPQRPDLNPISVAMQATERQVGFQVDIVSVDSSALSDMIKKGTIDWNAALYSWDCIWGSGFIKLARMEHTGGDYNYGGISDPELDALIDRIYVTSDETQRNEMIQEAQRIIIEQQGYEFYLGGKYTPTVVAPAYRDYKPSHTQFVVTFETKPTNP